MNHRPHRRPHPEAAEQRRDDRARTIERRSARRTKRG